MFLYDEIYFEITLVGTSADLDKFERFLKSGELDEFFEVSSGYINRDESADGRDEIVFTNDDMGIEISRLDPEEFLDVFCKAARALEVHGSLYDAEDNEYGFNSPAGDSSYYDSSIPMYFNDELDEAAREEEVPEEEDEE